MTSGRARAPKLIVFIDGWCARCRLVASWIVRADQFHQIEIRSFREDASYLAYGITADALLARMHSVHRATGEVVTGFDAVCTVVWSAILLRPLAPLLWLLRMADLGPKAYDYLALRRRVVPDSRVCTTTCGRDTSK